MKQILSILLILSLVFMCAACSSASSEAVSPPPEDTSEQTQIESPTPSETSSERTASPTASEPAAAAGTDSGSASAEPVLETQYPVTLTDMDGHESTIEASDRIISLTTSSTQILMAEGAGDRVVGVDSYSSDLMPDVEVVGDYITPDIEKIVSLEPDLIIAANSIQQDAIDQLRGLGIPTIAAEPTTWEQVPEGFQLIGEAVNCQAQALELTETLAQTVAQVQSEAPAQKITSYYVLSFGDAGNWTSGKGSFINSMMEIAGGDPVTRDTDAPWLEYSMEDLVSANPDCIILGSGAGSLEDLRQTPGYADLTAVQNGNVYEIDSDLVTIPGPDLNEGLRQISKILQQAAGADLSEAA